ncbi:hypothetical protein L2E82_13223 [Cichorium intybus]|uniref:Uncharacterized protein n=1 Tax=Cichorium intybus TaxID=13427 RepID=A0ACB9GHQ2_CICIN|nr:hypothetical protein L2E82_13223 [Cichorium intybus]
MVVEGEETVDLTCDASDLLKLTKVGDYGYGGGAGEEIDSALLVDDSSARALKRPRSGGGAYHHGLSPSRIHIT